MSRMTIAAIVVAAAALPLVLMLAAAGASSSVPAAVTTAQAPSALAARMIPQDYLAWYIAAAQTCPGLPWAILAGIGTVESGNGQSAAPGVHNGTNAAGAEGPMQFEPATFAQYAVKADPDAPLSPYDPQDAIFTAANMLCANGAKGGTPQGIKEAIYAYNHAGWYVDEVLNWAAKYGTATGTTAAEQAISFAEAQLGKPYQWGAAGPDAFDCSGLVYAAYASAGVTIGRTTFQWRDDGPSVPLDQLQPGDLLFYAGSDGSAANPGHVVMFLGKGQVIQAPQTGQPVQIDPLDLSGVVVATRPAALATSTNTQGGTSP